MALPGNPAYYERPAGMVENVPLYVLDTNPAPTGYGNLIIVGLVILALAFIVRGFR